MVVVVRPPAIGHEQALTAGPAALVLAGRRPRVQTLDQQSSVRLPGVADHEGGVPAPARELPRERDGLSQRVDLAYQFLFAQGLARHFECKSEGSESDTSPL